MLILICILGLVLQIHNISDYKIYPDSYVNLVVAKNIENYSSTIGRLGKLGMVYPDVFFWTRPMLPILIILAHKLIFNPSLSVDFINAAFSVLSILLVYLLLLQTTKSKIVALLSSLIFTVSYNHIVWSGFILTEATAVFFFLLFLYCLFKALNSESFLLKFTDLIAGLSFVLLVLTRYEFVLLIIPIMIISLTDPLYRTKNSLLFLFNFLLSAFFTATVFAFWLAPWPFDWKSVLFGLKSWIILVILGFFGLGLLFLLSKIKKVRIVLPILFGLALLASALFFPSVKQLLLHDFLLLSLFFVYLSIPKQSEEDFRIFMFVSSSFIILGLLYLIINPGMERYWTNLIPILILAIGYVLNQLLIFFSGFSKIKKVLFVGVFIFLFFAQGYITYQGMHKKDNGIWFKPGYEEVVSRQIKNLYPNEDLLLVSFPETYYIFTDTSVQSINDHYPYIYIDDSVNDISVLIVRDYAMQDQFPNFDKFLEENLSNYRINSFQVSDLYRFADRIEEPKGNVEVYRIKLRELKSLINSSGQANFTL